MLSVTRRKRMATRERDLIPALHRVEAAFERAVQRCRAWPWCSCLQEAAAQHRREGQRDEAGDQNRHHDGDRELVQQAAHDAAHEQHRDEHGDQRDGHGENGEADLARRRDGGLHARLAHLHVAHDVLQHHDGVVHHEAHRERERHQREIVQAVAQQVHHGERADDGERHGAAGNQGGGEIAQEQEDHQHDEADGQHQGELHVADGAADGLRRVEGDREIDGRRNLLAELRAAARLTLSTTSTVLVPGCRWMARMTARLSLYQATILSLSTLSMTLPSSSRRTGVPLRQATMIGR